MKANLERFDTLLKEGRIIRKSWTGEVDGKETACLLAALSPEVAAKHQASACPASLMPAWLAELTPWMDDYGSLEAWPGMIKRYGALAHRWHVLDAAAWKRLGYESLAIIVRDARNQTKEPKVLEAVDSVLALLDRAAAGEKVAKPEFYAAAASALAAAREADAADWAAALAAARAADAAAEAAADAAAWAAGCAARADARADARAADAAAALLAADAAAALLAAARAEARARAEAVDRITAAILDAIERECVKAETK